MDYHQIWVTLAARDFTNLVDFYGKLLGKFPDRQIPKVYAEFHLLGLRLGIYAARSQESQELPLMYPSMSLCFQVANLEAAIAQLEELGGTEIGSAIESQYGRELYVRDPEGNRFVLYEMV
jgi:predicted enzyme related to lactoylglutathione lyase